jgi:RNA polymerase sigma-70 factor (sigma-E family)
VVFVSDEWEREFAAYMEARGPGLRNLAYLLCGDWHRAEDHAQTALTKLYLAWRRIERRDEIDAYARRVLVRVAVDERRRPWRRERSSAALPEEAATPDLVDERVTVMAALAMLPGRQRAAIVLRYWSDLSVAEAAGVLGVTEGTVKSSCARGLVTLREVLQGSRLDETRTDKEFQ